MVNLCQVKGYVPLMHLYKTSIYILTTKMSEKLWVRAQNAYREAFWTSLTDRVPRIRAPRDRVSRGIPVYI